MQPRFTVGDRDRNLSGGWTFVTNSYAVPLATSLYMGLSSKD